MMGVHTHQAKAQRSVAPAVSRTSAGPETYGVERPLERLLGNQAFGAFVQTKLAVGTPDDPYEHEADRVAEQVMRMAGPDGMPPPFTPPPPSSLSPSSLPAAEEVAPAAKPGGGAGTPPPSSPGGAGKEADAGLLTRGGSALPPSMRQFYESRFDRDFSRVRVHTGPEADRQNEAIRSYAFTYGNHIWLGREQPVEPSFIFSHEMAHVVQQTQPAALAPQAQPYAAASAPDQLHTAPVARWTLQRYGPYWEPYGETGTKTHNKVLPKFGKTNKIFTEAPVPNADRLGFDINGKKGEADLYGASEVVGFFWLEYDVPRPIRPRDPITGKLPPIKIKKDGKSYRKKFEANAAPAVEDVDLGSIHRVDTAPTDILIGDLKPSEQTIEADKGVDQIGHYIEGFKLAARELNTYAVNHPGLVKPAGKTWNVNPNPFPKLTIPPDYQWGSATGPSVRLQIKQRSSKNIIYAPKTPIMGKLYVSKDRVHSGIWNYYWWPDKPVTVAMLSGLDMRGRMLRTDVMEPIMTAPLMRTPKLKPGLPAPPPTPPTPGADLDHTLVLGRDRQGVVRRKKPPQARQEDRFKFGTWDATRKTHLKAFEKLKESADFPKFEGMLHAIEVQKALRQRVEANIPEAPRSALEAHATYNEIDFWTGAGAIALGRLRDVFGEAFVKIYNIYHGIRARFQDRLKGREGSFKGIGGGLLGSAVRVIFKVLKKIGSVVIDRTLGELADSLTAGVEAKMQSLFDSEKLLEMLLDPAQREAFDARLAELKTLQADLQKQASETVEGLIEKIIGPYDKTLEKLDKVQELVSNITKIVSLVRWGARVIACLSPPGWGCLWILAESALEKFGSMVIETCWFQKEITPRVAGISFVDTLPKTLAGIIIDEVKDKVLPESLHDLLPKPEHVKTDPIKAKDIKCDDNENSAHALTPERRALLNLQKRLGEAKFKALMRLVMKAGVPSDRKLLPGDVERLSKLVEDVGEDAINKLADNYIHPGPDAPTSDLFTFLEENKPEPPSASGSTGGGGAVTPDAAEDGDVDESVEGGGGGGKETGPPVVDGEKSKLDKLPPGTMSKLFFQGLVLNPMWKHRKKETHKIDIRYYEKDFDGPARYVHRNVTVRILKRVWVPNAKEKKALRILYEIQDHHQLARDVVIFKGGVVVGYVDAEVGR